MKKNIFISITIICLLAFITACSNSTNNSDSSNEGDNTNDDSSENLTIYTAREGDVVDKVEEMFNEEHPEIDLEILTMGAEEIMERVRGEKDNPAGDFWWGGTESTFKKATDEDLLEPYELSHDDEIEEDHKDPDNHWYGEMLLPDVIMINNEELTKEEAPKDWDDLIDSKWEDEILIRDVLPSGTMRTIYSAMIYKEDPEDPEKGYEWLNKLDANTKEYSDDPTNLYLGLARQLGTVSVWNLQDILLQANENNQPFDYVYPESGAPILVDGAGIIKDAENKENAETFFEFLFESETAIELAEDTYQIPTRTDIEEDAMPEWYQELDLKEMDLDWDKLNENEDEWMEYWNNEIKNQN